MHPIINLSLSRRPRLLLVDDHGLFLAGLRSLLQDHFDIAGTAGDGRSAISAFEDKRPDLVLLDVGLPQLNGMEVTRRVKAMSPAAKVLIVSMQTDRIYLEEAFRAGASGYVAKQSAATELTSAIQAVLAGDYYVSPSLIPEERGTPFDPRHVPVLLGGQLTPRQREVLQLVAEGKTMKEIAQALSISVRTVEFHKTGIMEQLKLRTTAELTRYAIDQGIALR